MPEVSLVAILDADKEGYLRSDRSLIQTIGRAARNLHGKAILYADKVTDSMKYLIDQTNRRRDIQVKYNKKHDITPKSIIKSIERNNLVYSSDKNAYSFNQDDYKIDYENIEKVELIVKLKKEMLKASKDLQFEKAAYLRDEIKKIEEIKLA